MFDYAALPTAELLELLFKEEDRVTAAHIQELLKRGDDALPQLRQYFQNEDYWYEGKGGDYWIVYHAWTILALHGKPEDIPLVMGKLMDVFFADSEWVMGALPALLAAFGKPIAQPLMDFIQREQHGYKDNQDYAQARYKAATALARLGQAHADLREPIFGFLSKLYTDRQENDLLFLTMAADSLVYLDRKRGLHALRAAYDRNAISRKMLGSYSQYVASLNQPDHHHAYDFEIGVMDFYEPEACAERQERWAQEAAEPVQLYWEPGSKPPTSAPEAWSLEGEPEAPPGYEVSAKGTVHNPGKVGRNDPCPCGSGKKFKKCHGTE